MKPKIWHIIAVTLLLISGSLPGQEVKSKTVKFRINNLPDTSPPVITILTPEMDPDSVFRTSLSRFNLIGEVTDESKIRFVSINNDIRMVNESGIFLTELFLDPGENRIRVVAMDDNKNIREFFLTVEYKPPVVTLADKIKEKSTYYGLIIGIDNYKDGSLTDLDNAVEDAEHLYNTLTSNYIFREENVVLLKNATRAEIIEGFDNLVGKVTPNDNLLIFYAGHGWWDENANIGYWLPSDANKNVKTNWFRNSTLVDYLKEINSKHTLLIADACFGGSIFKTRSAFPDQDKAYEKLYELPSRKAMTSGMLTEVPDRSSFTRYLNERLQKNDEVYLSSEQLFSSFRIAVINNSDAIPQYGEIGNVGDQGGDFIFIKK